MLTHALVLTAGLGTRLQPLTRVRAKPAVPVAGEPIVTRIIRWLARQQVTELTLNLHHLPETLAARVGDGTLTLSILEALGYRVWFRYQKYREEFAIDDCIIAIDETPVGVFIEIEGGERGIEKTAQALGRSPSDYLLDSYRGLFVRHCQQNGVSGADMLFDAE